MKQSVMTSTPYKIYVDVAAEFTPDGQMLPLWIRWEDGKRYMIDKVKHYEKAASRKAGGIGLRYTVMIQGQERYLFYEGNYQWFVEAKTQ